MPVREKFVRSGDWRTLETFWNVTTTAWFQKPAGAEVKIRYSGWWFGADRQRQRLDGSTVKRLVISRWSVFTARLQIRVSNDTAVIYVVEAGDVANLPPGISFDPARVPRPRPTCGAISSSARLPCTRWSSRWSDKLLGTTCRRVTISQAEMLQSARCACSEFAGQL